MKTDGEFSKYTEVIHYNGVTEIKNFITLHLDKIKKKDKKIKNIDDACNFLLQTSVFHVKKQPKIFDWKRYIQTFPDLKKVIKNSDEAVHHYLHYGIRERRQVYVLGSNEIYKHEFNWKDYITINQDLKFILTDVDAFHHFITGGYKNRKVTLKEMIIINDRIEITDDELINKRWKYLLSKHVSSLPKIVKNFKLDHQGGIDMFKLKTIDDKNLKDINLNIYAVTNEIINEYKNILFVSGDYPGYGGAATNCYNLQQHFKKHGMNTFGFYFNFEKGKNAKYENNIDYIVDDIHKIFKIKFKPDLIILKSPIKHNLKKIFKCPVYYLIGGIYKNDLNKYFYDISHTSENDKYINPNVLHQTRMYDRTYVNSSHTQLILSKYYNIHTSIFYSSFVQYFNEKPFVDKKFNSRKYDYGLIVSNFGRKIKNIEKSIQFLKGKSNVILIGKESNVYKSYGFECIDLVDKKEMTKYYREIKFLVQDSFYESCSNVKIEGLFNGCKIPNIKNIVFASGDYPLFGGAATNAYALTKWINSKLEYNAITIINNSLELSQDKIDPHNTGLVYHVKDWNEKNIKNEIIKLLPGNPDIIYVKKYNVGINLKKLFPDSKVFFLLSSVVWSEYNWEKTDKEALYSKEIIPESLQQTTFTDKIIVNSELSKSILLNFNKNADVTLAYTSFIINNGKNYSFLKLSNKLDQNWDNRKYDIGFAASCCNRVTKNIRLFIDIIKNEEFNDKQKLIIGRNSEQYKNIKNCNCFDIMKHDNLMDMIKNTKLIIIPSHYESLSNFMIEAINYGCNILISDQIGGYEFIIDQCIARNNSEYLEKTKLLLEKQVDCLKSSFNYSEDNLTKDLFL